MWLKDVLDFKVLLMQNTDGSSRFSLFGIKTLYNLIYTRNWQYSRAVTSPVSTDVYVESNFGSVFQSSQLSA